MNLFKKFRKLDHLPGSIGLFYGNQEPWSLLESSIESFCISCFTSHKGLDRKEFEPTYNLIEPLKILTGPEWGL